MLKKAANAIFRNKKGEESEGGLITTLIVIILALLAVGFLFYMIWRLGYGSLPQK